VDREGRTYVVDAAFNNVQVFDKNTRLLLAFGALGDRRGDLMLPSGIAISYEAAKEFSQYVAPGRELEYVLAVSSQYGPNKVNVYGFLKPRPGEEQAESQPPAPLPAEPAKGATAAPAPGAVTVDNDWLPDSERNKDKAANPLAPPSVEKPASGPAQTPPQ
jgi:hypothetical protein